MYCCIVFIINLVSKMNINTTNDSQKFECDEKEWNEIFDVNIKNAYYLAREVLPYLQKQKNGKIVFITAIAAYHSMPITGIYSVAKTGLIGLTKMLALELADKNINVNAIAPGIIKTNFSKTLREGEFHEKHISQILLKRYGIPEEVAASVAFLVSPDANYITGEVLVVAGGMSSRL